MTPAPVYYPWYAIVSGDELQQGDIFESCPVFSPAFTDLDNPRATSYLDWQERSVIVSTQSCDIAKEHQKTEDVLVCALWDASVFPPGHYLSTQKGLENVRQGSVPGFHMLAPCDEKVFVHPFRLVDFRRVWSLPIGFVRRQASRNLHLRLLPPYREQMSQAFARFFMRVGLPSDIPPFR
jgi:hypothetical protein